MDGKVRRFYKPHALTPQEAVNEYAVAELIAFERYCPDNGLWEKIKSCYSKSSHIKIGWYQRDGATFVEKSSAKAGWHSTSSTPP